MPVWFAAPLVKMAIAAGASKLASSAAGSGGNSGGGDPGFIPMSAGEGNQPNYNSIELNSGMPENDFNPQMRMRRKMNPFQQPSWQSGMGGQNMNGGQY